MSITQFRACRANASGEKSIHYGDASVQMKKPFDHIQATKQELRNWGIRLVANRPLASVIQKRYIKWKYRTEFDQIVPPETVAVEDPARKLLYLWGCDDIVQTVVDAPDNTRYLVFGSLCDGSYLALDTKNSDEMKIGAFPFEECSSSDGMVLSDDLFVSFPFQYHEYLNYLHTAPEFDDYLFGYGR